MAEFMAESQVYRVIACSYTPTQIGLNVMYWKCTGTTGTGVTLQALADRFDDLWAFTFKQSLSENARWRGVSVQRIAGFFSPLIWTSTVNDGVGGVAGNLAPTQTSGVISKRSVFPGKHGRGRLFIPFPSVNDVQPTGAPTVGYVTVLESIAVLMNASVVTTLGGDQGTVKQVVRRDQSGIINFDLVEQTIARNRYGTQRRRGQYGSTNILPF